MSGPKGVNRGAEGVDRGSNKNQYGGGRAGPLPNPQTELAMRGSYGVVKGPLKHSWALVGSQIP